MKLKDFCDIRDMERITVAKGLLEEIVCWQGSKVIDTQKLQDMIEQLKIWERDQYLQLTNQDRND